MSGARWLITLLLQRGRQGQEWEAQPGNGGINDGETYNPFSHFHLAPGRAPLRPSPGGVGARGCEACGRLRVAVSLASCFLLALPRGTSAAICADISLCSVCQQCIASGLANSPFACVRCQFLVHAFWDVLLSLEKLACASKCARVLRLRVSDCMDVSVSSPACGC